jgi:thioredoxin reductase
MMGVTGLRLQDDSVLPLDGVFVAIGSSPFTKIVDGLNPDKDTDGTLIVDKRQETTVK